MQFIYPVFLLFFFLEVSVAQTNVANNLEEALKTPESITILHLSNQPLTFLDIRILELVNLQELKMDSNRINILPLGFSSILNQLKKISATHNRFGPFFELGFSLPQLQWLDLSYNEIREIRAFSIYNPIRGNPDLTADFKELKALEFLNVSHNQIKEVDAIIGQLSALKQLDLSYNKLLFCPEEIWTLEQLEILDLSYNQISFISGEPFATNKLKRIDLSHNRIHRIVTPIYQLPCLEYLDVSYCSIFGLPNKKRIFQNSSIKTLLVSNNKIGVIHRSIRFMHSLEQLDLSNNNIKKLPRSISKIKNIKKLNLSNNPISDKEKQKIKKLLPNCEITF